jgi:hypothetical protein
MTNSFGSAFTANLPASITQAVPADQLAQLKNPQILLSPQATAQLQQSFTRFGAQGDQLFNQLMLVIRESLASAITSLFFIGMLLMIVGLVASFFLKEIPLRTVAHVNVAAEVGQVSQESGQQMAVAASRGDGQRRRNRSPLFAGFRKSRDAARR